MTFRDEIINNISAFPTLPVMANKLITMLQNPDTGPREISDVLQYDPALTANVLKAANSAFLGFNNPVSSLSEASFRIGTKWVLQLAMSSLIYSNINLPAKGYGLTSKELWIHSIAVAMMAENICRLIGLKENGTTYTAGLLHDIGKIAMESQVMNRYEMIQQLVDDNRISFEEAEKIVLGVDHAEVGALIAQQWAFPNALADTIRWHHHPDEAPETSPSLDIVHIADAVCLMQGYGIGRDGLQYKCSDQAMKRLSLTSLIIEKAVSSLASTFKDIEDMFTISPAPAAAGR